MLETASAALVVVYFAAALTLLAYGLNCYVLVGLFLRRRSAEAQERYRVRATAGDLRERPDAPCVTTQIPIDNEYNVAARVIEAACRMVYAPGCHQVQVVDDSTDETAGLVRDVVARLRREGHDIELVQTRWGHLNRDESLLTRAQAMGIDGHFMVEQSARAWNGLVLNFNGTAGLWRRSAIDAAGGWQGDTLTEDLDLSYRARFAGWHAVYLPDVVVPAEIPADINAFKSQQFRWAKGSMQTAVKLLPRLFASTLPWFTKAQAFPHLTHYVVASVDVALGATLAPGPLRPAVHALGRDVPRAL